MASMLEVCVDFAAVVWSSSLNQEDTCSKERVKKCAFAVIVGLRYNNYEAACASLSMETLASRREKHSLKFCREVKSPPHTQTMLCIEHSGD